ncbi:MAG: hypothetical protein E7590_01145 [Ruminococcaceae bacterium]|nr:hypothetical protein [Oscillospiraceae bacterium]
MQEMSVLQDCFVANIPGKDMTAAIEEKLNTYGACCLGSGTYLVSGVRMPPNATLSGLGRCTRLLLDPALEAGSTVSMDAFCCVKDLFLCGAEQKIELPEEPGARHGILYRGTATTKDWMGEGLKLNAIISGCWISGYNGGGITCVDTGYYIRASLTATNCHIFNCGTGLNISHFSEYHAFTNIQCCENGYGCINNGGNNKFVNCAFDGNRLGFMIDNLRIKSPNHSHGSVVGCSFNHTDNNKGIGILLLGATNGYIFSGCQMFYSRIVIEASAAIAFNAINFGRLMDIEIKGDELIAFSDCVFGGVPARIAVSNPAAVKFSGCYTRHGKEIRI